ncbi:hypothetical protein RvY_05450 [Ramazzottius varieornatus]|uniref:General transcription factor TFIIB n=1 Tax=Ramazzottius varieornatus TaxID=947166 RepID=A0A1D1UV26_RAMVA|nr:hypothetical protein RvY_05450 [Ramazzottius varieornatus]
MSDKLFMDRVCCKSHPDARMIDDYASGNLVCSQCGLVVGDRLVDPGSEWRNFGDGVDNSRVGKAEDMFHDGSDLSTMIGPTPLGSNGTKYLKSTTSPKERAFKAACKDIENVADRAHLPPSVIETAIEIYKEVTDKKTFAGSRKDALGICCLYIACRQRQIPQSLEEICGTSQSTRKQVAKCYKEVMKYCKLPDTMAQVREKDFVDRYGSAFGLDKEAIKVGKHLAEAATKSDLFPSSGPDLIGAAAVVVVKAMSGEKAITFQEIVQMNTGITKHAITDAYKKMLIGLETKKDEFLPKDFKPKVRVGRLPKAAELA